MAHVNNAAYVDYLEEALIGAGSDSAAALRRAPRRVRLEYLQPVAPLTELTGAAWPCTDPDGDGWAWRLTDDASDAREMARGRVLAG